MPSRILLSSLMMTLLATPGFADTVLVDEDFDSYADTAAMQAVWTPDDGMGNQPLAGPVGILVPDLGAGLIPPNDDPPGIEGNGVNILNDINEYNGPNVGALDNLIPTESQSIRLGGDIFDDTAGNKRQSIGLRNDTIQTGFGVFGTNIVEMGFWNANTFDPEDPANTPPDTILDVPSTGYAYRVILFGPNGGDLVRNPNWQYFELDLALDIDDSDPATTEPTPDGLVSPIDIGPGWHRYETIITPTDITFTLDLFRDGVKNLTRDLDGNIEVGVGDVGVDASVTWIVQPNNNPEEPNDFDPFTSLRFGAPSGISGNNESVVDNILLELVDVATGGSDIDGDGDVDGTDYLQIQTDNPGAIAQWQLDYPAPLSAISAVPEPGTASLMLLASLGLVNLRRR